MESAFQSILNAPTAVQDNQQRLWTCEVCNHPMGERSQQSHLAGKKHKAKAQSIEQRPNADQTSSKMHENLTEVGPSRAGAPGGEIITDPVKLSYMRMIQQMELYCDIATKKTKGDSASDTQIVHPETVLRSEDWESDKNGNSTTTNIPLAKVSPLQLRKKSGLQLKLTPRVQPPSTALLSLKAARQIKDFKNLNYPAEILSPGLSQQSAGYFKYSEDFLMQFENVFTEEPCVNWDKKLYGLFGDGAPLTEAARATPGLTTLPLNMMTSSQRFGLSKTGGKPEIGANNTCSGIDITQKSPEGPLKGLRLDNSRTGKRSSRGSRKNKKDAVDGTEPEQGDIKNLALPTAGFGSFSKTPDSSEREITPIPDNPPYTAHIGNLNFEIETQEILDFFSECDAKIVRLVRDKLGDRPKGFGYVEFNTKEGLIAAIELNGVKICGRNIRVNIAMPPKASKTERPATGGWRDTSANLEFPVNNTPIAGLSAMVRTPEESGGRWRRPTVVEVPQVGRTEGWIRRNTTLGERESPKAKTPKWDCVSCGISIALDKKEAHLGGLRHAAGLKKHGQQQRIGSNSSMKDERGAPLVFRQPAKESDFDVWGDWES